MTLSVYVALLQIGYLESRDQFISFAASKALIYVMLYSGVEVYIHKAFANPIFTFFYLHHRHM